MFSKLGIMATSPQSGTLTVFHYSASDFGRDSDEIWKTLSTCSSAGHFRGQKTAFKLVQNQTLDLLSRLHKGKLRLLAFKNNLETSDCLTLENVF